MAILVAATAALVAVIVPVRRVSVASAGVAAAGLLAALVALVSRHGGVVELDPAAASSMMAALGLSKGGLVEISTAGPYWVDVSNMPVTLALLSSAAGVSAGLFATLVRSPASSAEPTLIEAIQRRLRARDAALVGLVLAWLAVAAQALRARDTVGSWGPVTASDHLAAGAAIGVSALFVVLVGLASSRSQFAWTWRSLLLGAMALLTVGALAGGLVSAGGMLEL
jgi:hypothetical protein